MMKRSLLIVTLSAAVFGAAAHASVWDHALTSPEQEAAQDLYDAKMFEGDTATVTATIQSASAKNAVDSITRAEAAYRAAAALRPRDAEPYFRIGNLLYQMYFACDAYSVQLPTCQLPWASQTQQLHTIEAWDEFERRAPLDPRISGLLLRRAILNTKLVNGSASDHAYLEAAARDYQAALDRSDGLSGPRSDEQLLGNLAETYMMLDRLDDSVTTYLQAVAAGTARTSTIYGLAVALDRNGAGEQAIRRILDQGAVGLDAFQNDLIRGAVFFVPKGEEQYYRALGNEAFGNYGKALGYWKAFIASGAHPEFQDRAREHIERLSKKQVHAEPPPLELEEQIW